MVFVGQLVHCKCSGLETALEDTAGSLHFVEFRGEPGGCDGECDSTGFYWGMEVQEGGQGAVVEVHSFIGSCEVCRGEIVEVLCYGILVDVFDVSETDFAFGFVFEWWKWQVHCNGAVVGDTKVIYKDITDGGGVGYDKVQSISFIVSGNVDMLGEV